MALVSLFVVIVISPCPERAVDTGECPVVECPSLVGLWLQTRTRQSNAILQVKNTWSHLLFHGCNVSKE